MDDTLYRCTVCGRVGTVGRCCGEETREPLNDLARQEQEKIKSQNLPKANACHQLSDRSCGCCMSCLHWRYTGGGSGECMNLSIYRDESFYCSDYSRQC